MASTVGTLIIGMLNASPRPLAVAEPIAEFVKKQLEQEKEDTKCVIVQETEKRMMA